MRCWRSDAFGCRPQRVVLRSRLVLDCEWSMKTRASWLERLVRLTLFFLPVSLLSECIFVESPILYCESRSCYALDALFIFFTFFKIPFLARRHVWPEILPSVHLFFSSCDFALVSDTMRVLIIVHRHAFVRVLFNLLKNVRRCPVENASIIYRC